MSQVAMLALERQEQSTGPQPDDAAPCVQCGEPVFPHEPGAVLVNNEGWCCSDRCALAVTRERRWA